MYPIEAGVPLFAASLAAAAGYDPTFFHQLVEIEPRSFWFHGRNELILRALHNYFRGDLSLLEIGCGTGFVLRGIQAANPSYRLSATDIHPEGLAFARARVPAASFYQADARYLPFRQSFDVVCAFDVIEHIEEDEAVLREARRVLKDGGGLVLTVPQHPWLWTAVDTLSGHCRRYTGAELTAKVRAAGFQILYSTSFTSALAPVLWLSRRFDRRGHHSTEDVIRQLDIAPAANAVAGAVFALERELLRLPGLRLPIGGSRLLVARAGEAPKSQR